MSLTLAKLQQLKRQAGGCNPGEPRVPREPAPISAPGAMHTARPAQASIDDLRQLLRVRAPAPAPYPVSTDRTLPGVEIAPGLHLREVQIARGGVTNRYGSLYSNALADLCPSLNAFPFARRWNRC